MKNMKRCPYCGAKNKDSFEYCVRCSESLDGVPSGGAAVAAGRGTTTTLMVGAAVVVLALVLVAVITGGRSEQAPAAAAAAPRPSAAAPPSERVGEPILVDIDSRALLEEYNEALAAYNARDYELAMERFADVVRDVPDNPSALLYLGLSEYHAGELDASMDSLERALAIRPNSFTMLDPLVTACKEAGRLDRAVDALQGFIQSNPDEFEARLELARLARELGDTELAIAETEYLAAESADDPEFAYEYGVTLKEAGRPGEAKTVLQKSIELDPSSAIAHHALGMTELVTGDTRAAAAAFEEAVAREPSNGDYRFSLAQAYEKLDRIPESLEAYEAYLDNAREDDARAEVVRRQLEIAKRALAAERARGTTTS